MKILWVMIAVAGAILLSAVSLNTGRIAMLLADFNHSNKDIINSNLQLANSNKLLFEEIASLRKQIAELSGKDPKQFSKKGGAE